MSVIDFSSPVRKLSATLRLNYQGAMVAGAATYLKSFEIQRIAEDSKFFGQVVKHRVNLKMFPHSSRDYHEMVSFTLGLYDGETSLTIYPYNFYPTEINYDEVNKVYSITAYDKIQELENHTISEISITAPYTIKQLIDAIQSQFIDRFNTATLINIDNNLSSLSYAEGANFEPTETIVDCLRYIAEVLNAVCYMGAGGLVFKRLDKDGAAAGTITKSDYFQLKAGNNKRLGKIIFSSELGDNIEASTVAAGSTQVLYDNPFLNMRDDQQDIVDLMLADCGGLLIGTFELEWRANLYYNIGDKLQIELADNQCLTTYLLDEVITFDGSLKSKLRFFWDSNKETTVQANPSTLGEVIKNTYAKVDKVNKQIELVANEVEADTSRISALEISTSGITASVAAITSSVAANATNISAISSSVATNISDIAQLKIDRSAIELSVSNLTTTLTSTNSELSSLASSFDNLEIGGRNLLKYGDSAKTATVGSASTIANTGAYYTWSYGTELINNNLEEWYTLQGDYEVSGNQDTRANFYTQVNSVQAAQPNNVNVYTNPSGHFTDAIKIPVAQQSVKASWWFRLRLRSATAGTTITVKNFKLEKGSKPTTFTVAPEDVDEDISDISASLASTISRVGSLEVGASSIAARVSTTETAITGIQTDVENRYAELTLTDNQIYATVTELQETSSDLKDDITAANDNMASQYNMIQQQLATKVTASDISIAINNVVNDGVNKVVTTTGYRLDNDGLTISKSDSNIATTIDNEGMIVSTQDEQILTATTAGVNAIDLTARNYLIFGSNSRLQDYGSSKAGLFWIGN